MSILGANGQPIPSIDSVSRLAAVQRALELQADLIEAGQKLVKQIEGCEYKDKLGHDLEMNADYLAFKAMVSE